MSIVLYCSAVGRKLGALVGREVQTVDTPDIRNQFHRDSDNLYHIC